MKYYMVISIILSSLDPKINFIFFIRIALGFMHMHNTQDRDNYVKINMDNIGYDADDNFRKFSNLDSFGEPYDYESVMHYSQFQFSGNDLATIEAIVSTFSYTYYLLSVINWNNFF